MSADHFGGRRQSVPTEVFRKPDLVIPYMFLSHSKFQSNDSLSPLTLQLAALSGYWREPLSSYSCVRPEIKYARLVIRKLAISVALFVICVDLSKYYNTVGY